VKLRIEINEELPESEVVIRCGRMDEQIRKLEAFVLGMSELKLTFYKGSQEFFIPLSKVLFLQTEGETVYAHTADDAFLVKHRLYELEETLPRTFVRAAKGTIVNTSRIYSIDRNLTSASKISFTGTHKSVYVSRHYYKFLKEKMYERSGLQ